VIAQCLGIFEYPHGERVVLRVNSNLSLLFEPDRIEWLMPKGFYKVTLDDLGKPSFLLLDPRDIPQEATTPVRYDKPVTRTRRVWRGQL
jgi:hypothetical protein